VIVKKPGVEPLCQWIKTKGSRSLQKTVRVFKKCCICSEMDGMENEEDVRNVGSEHETVSSECKTRDTELETDDKNEDEGETDEAK
jgi:hypothetical protein